MARAFLPACFAAASVFAVVTVSATRSQQPAANFTWAIEPRFDAAGQFRDGLAPVFTVDGGSGKWGFIDRRGQFVIAPQFDEADNFAGWLAAVLPVASTKGKRGDIDATSVMAIPPT